MKNEVSRNEWLIRLSVSELRAETVSDVSFSYKRQVKLKNPFLVKKQQNFAIFGKKLSDNYDIFLCVRFFFVRSFVFFQYTSRSFQASVITFTHVLNAILWQPSCSLMQIESYLRSGSYKESHSGLQFIDINARVGSFLPNL